MDCCHGKSERMISYDFMLEWSAHKWKSASVWSLCCNWPEKRASIVFALAWVGMGCLWDWLDAFFMRLVTNFPSNSTVIATTVSNIVCYVAHLQPPTTGNAVADTFCTSNNPKPDSLKNLCIVFGLNSKWFFSATREEGENEWRWHTNTTRLMSIPIQYLCHKVFRSPTFLFVPNNRIFTYIIHA